MPKNYKSEKPKGGIVEGVALANGKGGYIPYSQNSAKTYGGQARANAAKNSLRKGY